MKRFLLAKNAATGGEVLVEWDTSASTLTIWEDGIESEYNGYEIKEGVVGVDAFFWRGKHFVIMQNVHDTLLDRFPVADHVLEYEKADEWLGGDSKRQCKSPLAFMSNWLKRARGGKYAKGGVIY